MGQAPAAAAPNQNRNQPVNLLDWSSWSPPVCFFFSQPKLHDDIFQYRSISHISPCFFFSGLSNVDKLFNFYIYYTKKNLILSNAPDLKLVSNHTWEHCSERGWNVWVCKNGEFGSVWVYYWLVPKYTNTDSDWPVFRESATNSLVRIGPKGASPDCFKCSALTRSKLSPLSPIWHWTRTRKAPNKEVGFNPGQPPWFGF